MTAWHDCRRGRASGAKQEFHNLLLFSQGREASWELSSALCSEQSVDSREAAGEPTPLPSTLVSVPSRPGHFPRPCSAALFLDSLSLSGSCFTKRLQWRVHKDCGENQWNRGEGRWGCSSFWPSLSVWDRAIWQPILLNQSKVLGFHLQKIWMNKYGALHKHFFFPFSLSDIPLQPLWIREEKTPRIRHQLSCRYCVRLNWF